MDKQSSPEITGQAAEPVEPADEQKAAEPVETTEAPAVDTAEAPAAPEQADGSTYEVRVVDPNLRSTADGRFLTSADDQSE